MALICLPDEQIPQMLQQLEYRASTACLQNFMNYVKETWIKSHKWSHACWSVYKQAMRTNNDM